MSAVTIWFVPFTAASFILLVAVTLAFNFFQCAVGPVSDTITLELASAGHFKFSRVRTVGSIGYAIMAAIAGKIFSNDISLMFAVYSVLMLAAFFTGFAIPKVRGHQSGKKKTNLFVIFKDKKIVCLYIYIFIMECTMWFFYTFHSVYSKELGISTQLIGLGVMIGSFSQFPFMIFFDKIYKKLGIYKILVISGFMHVARWVLYATVLNADSILFIWLLHGCTYIVLYLCLAEYVNNNVIKDLKTSGQMMNALILQGISKIVGSMLGGTMASYITLKYTFLLMAAICLIATSAFAVFIKYSGIFKANSAPAEPAEIGNGVTNA
jgi:PPP family 3-phenylpropionic acid transporter